MSNFNRVVYDFLGDRHCKEVRKFLGSCYKDPDFNDELENHIRAAALLAGKSEAYEWLSYTLTPLNPSDPSNEGIVYASKLNWSEIFFDQQVLENAYNVFEKLIWKSVGDFKQSGSSNDKGTDGILKSISRSPPKPVIQIEDDPYTIWQKIGNSYKCVDGNHRIHRLLWNMVSGTQSMPSGWRIWVGK